MLKLDFAEWKNVKLYYLIISGIPFWEDTKCRNFNENFLFYPVFIHTLGTSVKMIFYMLDWFILL